MKVLVCLKQVPDPETLWVLKDYACTCSPPANARFQINSYDEYALEEAVILKESGWAASIDLITAGPARAAKVLERGMGMGADQGFHILIDDEELLRPDAVSSLIAGFAQGRGYDLIICGVMSEDSLHGQVGPMLAARLGLVHATSVISLQTRGKGLTLQREIEGGRRQEFQIDLPALVTIQSGINRPRYPSLSNVLRAKKQGVHVIPTESLPHPQSTAKITGITEPVPKRAGLVLTGNTRQKAVELRRILRERALL